MMVCVRVCVGILLLLHILFLINCNDNIILLKTVSKGVFKNTSNSNFYFPNSFTIQKPD